MTARKPEAPSPVSDTRSASEAPGATGQESLRGCLVRGTWILGGNALVVLAGVLLLLEHPWTITAKDAVFWAAVFLVVGARYVDIKHMGGRTVDGGEATPAHLRRHAMTMTGGSAVYWVVAQSLQVL
jgi:hypothetical protein